MAKKHLRQIKYEEFEFQKPSLTSSILKSKKAHSHHLKSKIRNMLLTVYQFRSIAFASLVLLGFAFFIFMVSLNRPIPPSEIIRGQTNIMNMFGMLMFCGLISMIWRQHKLIIPRGGILK